MKEANPNLMTDLHLASAKGDVKQVQTLLDHGARADVLNQNLQPPLFNALMLPVLHDDTLAKNKQTIFDLLHKNAPDSIKRQDISGDSIVHIMAVYGYERLLKTILEHQPELNARQNNHGRYPIHAAILNGQVKVANVLLTSDVNTISQTDSRGQSALHYAALYGTEALFKLCYSFDKDANKVDTNGNTPFILAAKANNRTVLEFLNQQQTLDCNATNLEGQNALHVAINTMQSQAALWLIEHTDIDVNLKDRYEQTPLSLAKAFDETLYTQLKQKKEIKK